MIAFLLLFEFGCTERVELGSSPRDATRKETAADSSRPVVSIVTEDAGLPVQTRDGRLTGRTIPRSDRTSRDLHRKIIDDELTVYPPGMLVKIGLKQVILCVDLAFDGTGCAAFADVERGHLYLNVQSGLIPAFIKRTLHHEIFHQIDFADDRKLDADPRWEAMNAPDFRYTHDAETLQADPESTRPDETLVGFLNRYATSSPAEDKSELYAALIVEPELVRRRAGRDEILRRKVSRVREMLDDLGRYAAFLLDH